MRRPTLVDPHLACAPACRYQSLFNDDDPSGTGRGPLSTVAEDEETGQPSEEAMARRRRRGVFGRAGSGVAGGGNQQNAPWVVEDDTWKSDMEDRSVTRCGRCEEVWGA